MERKYKVRPPGPPRGAPPRQGSGRPAIGRPLAKMDSAASTGTVSCSRMACQSHLGLERCVVEFYKTSMLFEFTDEEAQDLVNFLSAL